MRLSQDLNTKYLPENLSVRVEKIFIYFSAIGFLSIAGIYLLFI